MYTINGMSLMHNSSKELEVETRFDGAVMSFRVFSQNQNTPGIP